MENKFYVAALYCDGVIDFTRKYGITADPVHKIVPLCSSQEGAIIRFLLDVRDNQKRINITDINTVYCFEIKLPKTIKLCSLTSLRPELQKYLFKGYPGTLPPKYIVGCSIADLTYGI